mmetsp:Transcript_98106/g.225064  ORF Transcript_98106/g.225064 Transcript_98106/m.225064 type:complete len:298 (+) Transcript_98106:34-927(+)
MFKKRARPGSARPVEAPSAAAEAEADDTVVVSGDPKAKRACIVGGSTQSQEKRDLGIQKYEAKRTLDRGDNRATAKCEVDTDHTHDSRAVAERNHQISKDIADGKLERGVYRGMGANVEVMAKSDDAIRNSKFSGTLGPTRGSIHHRAYCRFDYQPDICKDYKETGYCGYGDSCKFLHDRSDYKSGWQLEKEWEASQKVKNEKKQLRMFKRHQGENVSDSEAAGSDSDSEDAEFPFACFICREKWADCATEPVVTNCKHYFCEDCALQAFQKKQEMRSLWSEYWRDLQFCGQIGGKA